MPAAARHGQSRALHGQGWATPQGDDARKRAPLAAALGDGGGIVVGRARCVRAAGVRAARGEDDARHCRRRGRPKGVLGVALW